jgi:hypothetical protein
MVNNKDVLYLDTRRFADEFLRSKKASKAEEIDSQIKWNNKKYFCQSRINRLQYF